jgi:(E)-4-hydroxy-3-methylbut-2-enyl-diphosphate synthase
MLSLPTADTEGCLAAISELAAAGCEIIRVAVPDAASLPSFEAICASSCLPVVADIHFDHRLAIEACRRGAAKLRINPGTIGSMAKVDAVIEECGSRGIPVRIGVNAGSLHADYVDRTDLTLPESLAASAEAFVAHFHERGFDQLVLSAKAHSVRATVAAYRLLAARLPNVPLHLGVTEAGTLMQGTVKSALGIGTLLLEGIGDTFRVSLTAPPQDEVSVAWQVLAAAGLRRRGPELVSCPTCGRCQVDLERIASEVEQRLHAVSEPLTVAVMGCAVNGPGEARGADVGVACGRGKGVVFSGGKILYTVDEAMIADALLDEIERRTPSDGANVSVVS